jgi:aspartate ammonia-lyase
MKPKSLLLASSLFTTLVVTAADADSEQTFRVEKDLLGEKQVPSDAYYGVQTARARELPDLR